MVWYSLGETLDHFGRGEEAAANFRRALDMDATFWGAAASLGQLLHYKLNRFDEAEAAYQRAVGIDPGDASVWFNLGNLYQDHLARYSESESAYRRALALSPGDAVAHTNLGDLYARRLGKGSEAEVEYRHAIELRPQRSAAWSGLAYLLAKDPARREDAAKAAEKAATAEPLRANVWLASAQVFETIGHFDAAERAARQAIELKPDDAHGWIHLGRVLFLKGSESSEAERALRRAMELAPSDAGTLSDLGRLLSTAGRFREAETILRQGLESAPNSPFLWRYLGILLARDLKRPTEGESAIRQALRLDPDDGFAWNYLGEVLGAQRRAGEAETAYRKAIDLEPDHSCPRYSLAALIARQPGRASEAEAAYRDLTASAPEDAEAWRSFAKYRRGQSDLGGAQALLERAIAVEPNDWRNWNELALCLLATSETSDTAERAARRAAELAPLDPFGGHTLATVLVRQRRWEEAVPLAKRFVALAPDALDATEWRMVLSFFRDAVAAGWAEGAANLLEEMDMREPWRPLSEALRAIADLRGERLLRLAPEIRAPAKILVDYLRGEVRSDRQEETGHAVPRQSMFSSSRQVPRGTQPRAWKARKKRSRPN